MHLAFAKDLKLKILPCKSMVTLANTDSKSKVLGTCRIKINTESKVYENVEVGIFENLCCDLLLGGDFLQLHKKVIFEFSEKGNELTISKSNCNALTRAKVDTPSLFANLRPECKPIATKSRQYNSGDQAFIQQTVKKWIKEGLIRPSRSPWRSQIVIVKSKDGAVGDLITPNEVKRRMCIDFSQTINIFTELDAYPIPRIDTMVNNLAQI